MTESEKLIRKCAFCGKDIGPQNYATFMARGKEVYICLQCNEKNKEAIGYMMGVEMFSKMECATLLTKHGVDFVKIEEKKKAKVKEKA